MPYFTKILSLKGRAMMKMVLLVSAVQFLAIAGASAAPPPSALQAPAGVSRVLGSSTSPYTATTAKEFADSCKQDESSCSAMVGQVLMDRIQFSPTSHICLPDVSYAQFEQELKEQAKPLYAIPLRLIL